MSRFRHTWPTIAIFTLALFVRILYNLTVAKAYYPLHDSLYYQAIGFHMLSQHCFCLESYITTVYRTPLWPILIALLSLIFGKSDFFARMLLCILDAGTCVLISLFARDLFQHRVGIIIGIIAALDPTLYIYTGWLYTETLYTFLLFAFCYTLYRLQRRFRLRTVVLSGALVGLLSLTRPNGLLVLLLGIAWLAVMGWLLRHSWRQILSGTLLMAVTACMLIAPWTVRNYEVSHSFVPVATGDGTVLLGAYNNAILNTPGYQGSWVNPLRSSPKIAYAFPLLTCNAPCEVARETAFRDAAIQWIKTHLAAMPYVLAMHLVNMWQPIAPEADMPIYRFPYQFSSKLVLVVLNLFAWPIYALALYGLIMTRGKWRELLFVYLILLFTILENLIFYGSPRFRAPIEPLLLLLSAGAFWWIAHNTLGTPLGHRAGAVLNRFSNMIRSNLVATREISNCAREL